MTIELITGTPGAGKTTFGVATRLVAESKRVITLADVIDPSTGEAMKVSRRLCVAGVRGLVMEHERLPHKLTGELVKQAEIDEFNRYARGADGKEEDFPVHQRLPGEPPVEGVQCLVQNWWLWCKPGDLIFVDEAQFLCPRGTMGKKPPYWVQALEIHRHYGVDFIFVTQHPGLIDAVIKALVGLHRHVRSVMGSPLCMVYTWDHASNPERFTLANKSQFLRRKAHYRLFHSSVAHVKPPTSGRSVLLVVPLLLAGAGVLASQVIGKWSGKAAPQPVAALSDPGKGVTSVAGNRDVFKPLELQGCFSVGDLCRCQDREGRYVVIEPALCKRTASSFDGLVKWEPSRSVPPKSAAAPASGPASAPHGLL